MSDIDTAVVDSLKALDLKRPIREADIVDALWHFRFVPGGDIRFDAMDATQHGLPDSAGNRIVPQELHFLGTEANRLSFWEHESAGLVPPKRQ